jgi:3-methyl-2-oxobutanoate hydroxymethyltransferase
MTEEHGMAEKMTVPALQQMKREGRRIAAAVAYDYQMAQILDRAGVDLISIGDSVGAAVWGQPTHFEVTVEQMVLVCLAVTRGAKRALVSCDVPFGPVQISTEEAVRAAVHLVQEGHAEMVKVDGAADFPDAVTAISRAGIPVFAQFGLTPQTSARYGGWDQVGGEPMPAALREKLLRDARMLEEAGASLLDVTNAGEELSGELARAVGIPVLGGRGSGPGCDGHIQVANGLIGYAAASLDQARDRYGNVARVIHEGISAYIADVREARPVRGIMPERRG